MYKQYPTSIEPGDVFLRLAVRCCPHYPMCGIVNSSDDPKCDCGYDFVERADGTQPRFAKLRPIWASFWTLWLIVTLADLVTFVGVAGSWDFFPNALLNIFTPILLGNLIGSDYARTRNIAVLILCLFVGDLLEIWKPGDSPRLSWFFAGR